MTGNLRRTAAIGLSVLTLFGTLNPISSFADTHVPGANAAVTSTAGIPVGTVPAVPPSTTPSAAAPSSTGRSGTWASGLPTTPSPSLSTSYSLAPTEFSLTVSPTRLVIGQQQLNSKQQVLVVNRGQAPAQVEVQKRNFIPASDGSLTYQADAPYAASSWVTVEPLSFEIQPGTTQVVTASVQAPELAEPGDHQLALIFLVAAGQTSSNIKINRGVGTPVYITVPGPVDDSVTLANFSATAFATSGPVMLSTQIKSTGTVHRDFRDNTPLTVDVAGTPAPFPDFTVPRGATRDITTSWDPPFLCVCHPTVRFVNADGTVESKTLQVIVFPLHWLAILVAAVLLITGLIILGRRRYRTNVNRAAMAMNSPTRGGDTQ